MNLTRPETSPSVAALPVESRASQRGRLPFGSIPAIRAVSLDQVARAICHPEVKPSPLPHACDEPHVSGDALADEPLRVRGDLSGCRNLEMDISTRTGSALRSETGAVVGPKVSLTIPGGRGKPAEGLDAVGGGSGEVVLLEGAGEASIEYVSPDWPDPEETWDQGSATAASARTPSRVVLTRRTPTTTAAVFRSVIQTTTRSLQRRASPVRERGKTEH